MASGVAAVIAPGLLPRGPTPAGGPAFASAAPAAPPRETSWLDWLPDAARAMFALWGEVRFDLADAALGKRRSRRVYQALEVTDDETEIEVIVYTEYFADIFLRHVIGRPIPRLMHDACQKPINTCIQP